MKFKQTFTTPEEHSEWVNTCEYIVLHHTGTGRGTIKGVLDGLYRREDEASCHYVIDENGDIYKLGNDTDILWHAGVSSWNGKTDLNRYSIGIELIWPIYGGFMNEQLKSLEDLLLYLCEIHKIRKSQIVRHKDIAPKRKTDPMDTLWSGKFKTYSAWIDSIFLIPQIMEEKFTKILEEEQKKSPNIRIFSSFEGDKPLTERETRQLLEIWLIRLARLFGKS